MKTFKKMTGLLLSVIMLFALCITAFGAQTVNVGGGTGSITVTNATEGKTYRLYKLFDATYSTENDSVAYTYTKTGASDSMYDLLTESGSPFTLEQVRDTDTYNVSTTASAETISAWIKSHLTESDGVLEDGSVLKAIASADATDSELTFENLAFGYYFVTSTLGTAITIDSNTPSKNIIDKNQGPSWDIDDDGSGKVITADSNKTYDPVTQENSVNVGDTVDFKIGVNTTNYNGDKAIMEYFINDSLDKGFEYDKDSIVVKIGETTLTASNAPQVGSQYSISWDDTNNSFRITIPWYDEPTETFASANANNTLTVTYSATLKDNDDTVYAGAGNKNTSTYDFRDAGDTPGPDPYHTVEEKETTTYTFALGFTKIDGKTKLPLAGAQFQLKNAAGQYLTATANSSGNYTFSGVTADAASATTFSTDSAGQLLVKGVMEGTYTVIETKAPDGYNQLASSIDVEASIDSASSYSTSYTTYYDSEGNVVETQQADGQTVTRTYEVAVADLIIENNAGVTLPDTGDHGTSLIYILGSVLSLGAAIVLILLRRRKNEA